MPYTPLRSSSDPLGLAMADRELLLSVLKEILDHVEDSSAERIGNQCTLCHTYRMKGHDAIAEVESKR